MNWGETIHHSPCCHTYPVHSHPTGKYIVPVPAVNWVVLHWWSCLLFLTQASHLLSSSHILPWPVPCWVFLYLPKNLRFLPLPWPSLLLHTPSYILWCEKPRDQSGSMRWMAHDSQSWGSKARTGRDHVGYSREHLIASTLCSHWNSHSAHYISILRKRKPRLFIL